MKITWFDRLLIKIAAVKAISPKISQIYANETDIRNDARLALAFFDEVNMSSFDLSKKRHGKYIGGFAGDKGCGDSIEIEGIGIVNVIRKTEPGEPKEQLTGYGSGCLP